MKKKKSEVVANGGISVRELVTPDEGSDAAKGSEWSQVQQKALEEALTIVPKTVADRWDEISKHVPGKTKADCIARYKYLAEIVKQKRQAASSQVS